MSSCDRVFDITELAESIFLELSISILLCRVQRTCRDWKAVVDESTRLQQALFLKPIASTRNELFALLSAGELKQSQASTARTQTIVEHPLLTKIGSGGTSLARLFEPNLDAILRPEASWRHFLVTQPPIVEVCTYTDNEAIGYRKTVNEAGVRLGELMPSEHAVRSLHASHIYAWVKWAKFSLGSRYSQLLEQIEYGEKPELRRLGLS